MIRRMVLDMNQLLPSVAEIDQKIAEHHRFISQLREVRKLASSRMRIVEPQPIHQPQMRLVRPEPQDDGDRRPAA
jgi:hypothetical protein